jgi:hypothetical protein
MMAAATPADPQKHDGFFIGRARGLLASARAAAYVRRRPTWNAL